MMMNLAWNISVNSYFFKPDMQLPVKKNNPPGHLSDYSTQKENKLFIAYILQY